MERMTKEELEKLKDFKVYVFEGDVYVKAEDYKEKATENKKLKEKNKEQYKIIESLYDNVKYFNHRLCDIDSKLIFTQEENKKLKSDLEECECSMHFENDEVGYRKRECKKLKERIDILYEFIERNDKLVDEVIAEEDLDKLNRYIYIDDDLVDRTLESED